MCKTKRVVSCSVFFHYLLGRLYQRTVGQINKYKPCYIRFREVVHVKPDMNKIIQVLISLLEEQEKVKIEYTLEETA